MLETILIVLIIAAAIFVLIRKGRRKLDGEGGCACGADRSTCPMADRCHPSPRHTPSAKDEKSDA
jgi:hypothetical protein